MLGDRLRSNGVNSEAYDIIVKYTASDIIGAANRLAAVG